MRSKRYPSLAEYFKKTGDTHEKLAQRLGVKQSWITRVTNGTSCSLTLAKRLSAATGVPVEAIGPSDEAIAS